jgi:hypothetical protein
VGNDGFGNVASMLVAWRFGTATGWRHVIVPAILAFLLNSAIKIFASGPSVGGGE